MISASVCLSSQPDTAVQPAKEFCSYTTCWDTIAIDAAGGFEALQFNPREESGAHYGDCLGFEDLTARPRGTCVRRERGALWVVRAAPITDGDRKQSVSWAGLGGVCRGSRPGKKAALIGISGYFSCKRPPQWGMAAVA